MKKVLIGMITAVSAALIASSVLACGGCWYGGGPTAGPQGGYHSGVNPGGSYQAFLNDTSKQREELAGKQAEYNAMMAQPNPDPKKAGQLAQEIVKLHDGLRAKAQEHGVTSPPSSSGGQGNPPVAPRSACPYCGGWRCW